MESLKDRVERIYARTKPEGGCLVYTGARFWRDRSHTRGYAAVKFRGRARRAHCLVAEYYLGPCPAGMETMHLCERGAQGCVTASHLRYGTPSENRQSAARHGKYNGGGLTTGKRLAKLTESQVREARAARDDPNVSLRALARQWGVNSTTVVEASRRNSYKWIA